MPHLRVSVALGSNVVEDRLCKVTDSFWLGDAPEAKVTFPGGRVWVERRGKSVWVQGFPLDPQHPLNLNYGAVHVVLEPVRAQRHARDWSSMPDPKMALVTMALMLLMAFVDTLSIRIDSPAQEASPAPTTAVSDQWAGVSAGEERYLETEDTVLAPDNWPPVVTFTTE